MPESHKQERRRIQKANRAAGIGDEQGRIVREKEPPKMSQCTVCQKELKITKTNTELKAHAGTHGGTVDSCFPGAAAISAEMAQSSGGKGGGGGKGPAGQKASKKKDAGPNLDDLLSAGLSGGPGSKKKKGKK